MQGSYNTVDNCERSKCAACKSGKGNHQQNKVNTIKKNCMNKQELKKDYLLSVKMMSADHYIERAPGKIYHTKGKSDPYDMFSGGCVFIYNASGFVKIKHKVDINATETVEEKLPLRVRLKVIEWGSRDNTLILGSSITHSLWRSC